MMVWQKIPQKILFFALADPTSVAREIFTDYLEAKRNGLLPRLSRGVNGMLKVDGRYAKKDIDNYSTSPGYRSYDTVITTAEHENPILLHHHLRIMSSHAPIDIDEVAPVSELVATITSGAMSYGSIKMPHGDLAEAHFGIGSAGSNDGEGGLPPRLYGTPRSGVNKQWASGRFGTTAEMLDAIPDDGVIQIKIAQGAKPGVGGELPGFKVDIEIATTRGCIPGNELISPPPHHDIYSIEDIKSLIVALKAAGKNVSVKLAATSSIGQVAVGVAKAGADEISIASNDGGTGAAKHYDQTDVGIPGILGLTRAHNALVKNNLRNNVTLTTSGGFKSIKDFLIHAIWADRFESGTIQLAGAGCVAIDKCFKAAQINEGMVTNGGCSKGITNTMWQYDGTVEAIEQLNLDFAAGMREALAQMGYRSLDDLKRDRDHLAMMLPGKEDLLSIKNNDPELYDLLCPETTYDPDDPALDIPLEELENRKDVETKKAILNHLESNAGESYISDTIDISTTDVAYGAGFISRKEEASGISLYRALKQHLPHTVKANPETIHTTPPLITLKTRGNGGQRYAFAASHGIHFNHEGILHDYVAGSMGGGIVSVAAYESQRILESEDFHIDDQVIAGHSCLYGASGGQAYFGGTVGDRFAVRNSGTSCVVTGNAGDFACEYMALGSAVFLGQVGVEFGAGMTGGIAAIYDPNPQHRNSNDVLTPPLNNTEREAYQNALYQMITQAHTHTHSPKAHRILQNWEKEKDKFQIVMPKGLWKAHEALRGKTSEGYINVDKEEAEAAREKLHEITTTFSNPNRHASPLMQVWLEQMQATCKHETTQGNLRPEPRQPFTEEDVYNRLRQQPAQLAF